MSSRPANQEPSREKSKEKPFLYHKQNSGRGVSGSTKTYDHGGRRFQFPKARLRLILSPIRFLKHFAGEIARGICMVSSSSGKRKPSSRSGKSSFSARSKPFVAPLDSHRVEAIEDCIQFINSSCTLSRSNSTTTNP